MSRFTVTILAAATIVVFSACQKPETASDSTAPSETAVTSDPSAVATATGSAPSEEKSGELRGVIVSRDPAKNTVTLEHERVEGIMDAMTMPFELRDGKVDQLPPDGTRIVATLHEKNSTWWVTGVRAAQ